MPLTYSKVSIPEPLVRRMENLLARHPEWGYPSPTSAMQDAIRRWIEERERQEANDDDDDDDDDDERPARRAPLTSSA